MSKKRRADESTIENRVYLFRELAAAFIAREGGLLTSAKPEDRERARAGLAEVARVACLVADLEDATPDELAKAIVGE
ncbi:MAG: hypothetical protein IPG17_24450 [Sandaracinaceae bacterium]|jgi:hypothetical protein|nr:hypothetical protein [Sandaracinaceae bacterium]MBP7680661.1 hypothetical protein [Deltaproteobacteria bacterium]MBK6808062.1 hypothetical protein [Sandaracinaceae bacterium]MBK7150962.1 hypothetical protein [Sandaracinaceae bacterium]MBK7773086.1 hypothetical protein [Sandaracinaceae bacterium]